MDLARWSEHALAGEDGGDLIESQGVVLDGEGSVNAADAVLAAKHRHLARTFKSR